MNSEAITSARKAILADLKRRHDNGDQMVRPLDERDAHRWHKPQDNYFAGRGEMLCPICFTWNLRYDRNSYNGHVAAACSTQACVRWLE